MIPWIIIGIVSVILSVILCIDWRLVKRNRNLIETINISQLVNFLVVAQRKKLKRSQMKKKCIHTCTYDNFIFNWYHDALHILFTH